jgi:eukaryotic-like serine/threonine-protein kinase
LSGRSSHSDGRAHGTVSNVPLWRGPRRSPRFERIWRIDADLATICLRCLQKHPEDRYRSAIELARDLRRYLNGEPIETDGRFKRAWLWCKRRPLLAALVVETVLLLVVATLAVFSGASAQEKDRREEVLRANEYAARWVAGTVLFKLNSYHDIVTNAARDFPPELYATLRKNEIHKGDAVEKYCVDLLQRYGMPNGRAQFEGFFILGMEGQALARLPHYRYVSDYLGNDYSWRDYFKGAIKLAEVRSRSAYISRPILSESTLTQRFAISAPIYDENNEPIGVLGAMNNTGATLGTLELKDPGENGQLAMVVAPRDNNRDTRNDPLPDEHVILVHDSLASGKTETLMRNPSVMQAIALAEASNPHRGLSQLLLTDRNAVTFDENFCDPVMDGPCQDASGKTKAGRWLAGFAPIGNTGFVAIVETPRDAASQPNQTLFRRLLLWGVLPFFLGTALIAGVVGLAQRKSKNRSFVRH